MRPEPAKSAMVRTSPDCSHGKQPIKHGSKRCQSQFNLKEAVEPPRHEDTKLRNNEMAGKLTNEGLTCGVSQRLGAFLFRLLVLRALVSLWFIFNRRL